MGIVIALCFASIAIALENYHWLFSLVVHFREWFLLVCGIGLLLVSWATRYRKICFFVLLFSAIFHLHAILPYWGMGIGPKNISNLESIDVLFSNLNSQNTEKYRLVDYLKRKQPGIVMLVEVNASWFSKIEGLKSIYPYSKEIIQEGNFGMAVLSKTELEVISFYIDKLDRIPALFLKTKTAIGEIGLVLLHAFPPIGERGTLLRNKYLDIISRKTGEISLPTLLCGDFNTTPWSSVFKKFLQHSSLQFSDQHMVFNTWPVDFFVLGLPIDHCVSKVLNIVDYQKGPNLGSDHWPLSLKVSGKKIAD